MEVYIQYAKKCFQRNLVYKFDYIIGIIKTLMQIFIYVSIWKALYQGNVEMYGISFGMVTTSFIISLAISNTFSIDDSIVYRKIKKGEITNELLKPVSFNGLLMAENIGNVFFRIVVNLFPSIIIASLYVKILPPASVVNFILFIFSIIFGFLVLYGISYIVSITSFWVINVWSISTIKNVFVSVLSGIMIPLWFMPQWAINIIKFTPFDSIYFIPMQIYLGQVNSDNIIQCFAKQSLWIAILYFLGSKLWSVAIKRLEIQGG